LVVLDESDVVSSYAGVRPLIANPDGSPSDISRAHQIRCPEPAWWDISGGKLTTYRLMAEQTVDQIVRHLRVNKRPCQTANEPLLTEAHPPFSGILPPPFSRDAVAHYVRREWAVTLKDVMIRRSGWHYYHSDAAEKATQVADWMAGLSDWSSGQYATELAAYRASTSPVHAATN
jgi:glycerol-3-phosphate dehydrogenase